MKQLYKLSVLAIISSMMIVSGCDNKGMMKKDGKKPMPKEQRNQKYQRQMNKGAMMDSNDGCMMRQQNQGKSRYNNGN